MVALPIVIAAVCDPGCFNQGECTAPNVCDCVDGFTGYLCEDLVARKYEGISKSFEPNMERARNLDLFCFIFQRSPLPTPHTCPI